jgi:hypothetical protein
MSGALSVHGLLCAAVAVTFLGTERGDPKANCGEAGPQIHQLTPHADGTSRASGGQPSSRTGRYLPNWQDTGGRKYASSDGGQPTLRNSLGSNGTEEQCTEIDE